MNNPWEITIHEAGPDDLDCLGISPERFKELTSLLRDIIEDQQYPRTVDKYKLISQSTKTSNENAYLLSLMGRIQLMAEIEVSN
jgi:uncharacterized protein (UPF0147 family)